MTEKDELGWSMDGAEFWALLDRVENALTDAREAVAAARQTRDFTEAKRHLVDVSNLAMLADSLLEADHE